MLAKNSGQPEILGWFSGQNVAERATARLFSLPPDAVTGSQ
jgi:hypothetical protein